MKNKVIKKSIKIIILLIPILIKLYFVSVQPIKYLMGNKYDDALMVNQATSILQGKWLGDFNSLTLVKGVATPIFIAFVHCLHIPFLIGQEILYDISVVFVIRVLSKVIKNKKILYLTFLIILFNPITYSTELCRVYRDGLYTSLTIFLIGFAYNIFLSRKENIKKQIKNFIGFGVTLSALYLCREESIWLVPFCVCSVLITIIFIIKDKEIENKKKAIGMYSISISIFIINILIICSLNYKYYGVFQLNQYWSKEFKEAYGAITRVIPKEKYDKVPVSQETLQRIYKISPKLKEIEEYISGEEAVRWSLCGDGKIGEIQGGWLHWAIIKGVSEKGYYKDAKTANQYYKELADEINSAIDEGKIEGYQNKRVTNVPVFGIEEIKNTIMECKNVIQYQVKLIAVDINVSTQLSNNTQDNIKWKSLTYGKLDSKSAYKGSENVSKLNILKHIKNIYEKINEKIFFVSIFCMLGLIVYAIIKHKSIYNEILILLGLLGIYLCRIFIITFTYVTMYTEALNTMYLANTYAVQMLFSLLAIIFFAQNLKKTKTNSLEKQQLKCEKFLTILIPCLNEEKTIGICVKKAKQVIEQEKLDAEVLVVDNGCTDKTAEIARNYGARVVEVKEKGYGNALRKGTIEALGKYVIMVDADDSYNILEIMPIVKELENGNDLVIGNRYKGNLEKGAIKFSHKYIGTPVISWIIRILYNINVYDANCGLRGYNNEKIVDLNCISEGMEYASEMLIKAGKANLKIKEIPINFYKDKREGSSHLKTIKDGVRHLKVILKNNEEV